MGDPIIIRKPLDKRIGAAAKLAERLKRVEYSNRKRARDKGARTEAVDFAARVVAWAGCCCICGDEIDLTLPGTDSDGLTLEHIIAIGQGGHHVTDNIGPAHRRCNLQKSHDVDTPKAAKIRRLRGETGQRARRERNGPQIKSRNAWPPKGSRKIKKPTTMEGNGNE